MKPTVGEPAARAERQRRQHGAGGHAGEDRAARDPIILGHAGAFPWLRDGDRMRWAAPTSCIQETNCVPAISLVILSLLLHYVRGTSAKFNMRLAMIGAYHL
jgi:hypothetical protein